MFSLTNKNIRQFFLFGSHLALLAKQPPNDCKRKAFSIVWLLLGSFGRAKKNSPDASQMISQTQSMQTKLGLLAAKREKNLDIELVGPTIWLVWLTPKDSPNSVPNRAQNQRNGGILYRPQINYLKVVILIMPIKWNNNIFQ